MTRRQFAACALLWSLAALYGHHNVRAIATRPAVAGVAIAGLLHTRGVR